MSDDDERGDVGFSLAAAVGRLPVPLWVFDIEGCKVIWANAAAVDLWAADSLEDLKARDFSAGMSDATSVRLDSHLQRLERGEVITETWTFYPHGIAKTVRCRCWGVPLDAGRVGMFVRGMLDEKRDVSVMRGVEAMRHTTVMISLVTPQGTLLTENPAALRAYDFSNRQDSYHAFVARFAEAAQGRDALEQIQSTGAFSGEVQVETKHGLRWHGLDGTLTTDPATGDPAIVINEKDITRQLAAERELREARDELEATVAQRTAELRATNALAAGVAHEINNPLTFVKANLQLIRDRLREGHRNDPDLTECLEDAVAGAERVEAIVRDLGAFARADEDQIELLDINDVVSFAMKLTAHQLRPRAQVRFSAGDVPRVEGSAVRLGQVLINLLVNAAHAIGDGAASDNEVVITTTTRPDDSCVVDVSDTGCGIEPEILDRIFDPFFTTRAHAKGAGLGLAISHQIVAQHGGSLSVESRPGRGSTFRIVLPAALAKSLESGDVDTFAPPPSRRARILVVDDEPAILRACRRVLRKHDVVVASSGRQVARLIDDEGPFDVILCDLMMPDGSGADVFATLQRGYAHYLERLVFITGGAFTVEMQKFLDSVSVPVVQKPIDATQLRTIVAEQLRS